MGWSGYTWEPRLDIKVDAHAGEREQRGERLHAELIRELWTAILTVINQDKYTKNQDAIKIDWY